MVLTDIITLNNLKRRPFKIKQIQLSLLCFISKPVHSPDFVLDKDTIMLLQSLERYNAFVLNPNHAILKNSCFPVYFFKFPVSPLFKFSS